MNKNYITKEAWSKIYNFLKSKKNINIKDEKRTKLFVNGVFWLVKTGAQWRELHSYYGNWNTVFKRFNRWSRKKIWEEMLQYCAAEKDLEYVMIDSTIIRAHACSAGYDFLNKEKLGRSVGGFTTKLHALVDALGLPFKFFLTEGKVHDSKPSYNLLRGINNSYILADKAYGGKKLRKQIRSQNCIDVIPSKKNALHSVNYDKIIYKERHLIECMFGKIKHFRRVFVRYEKTAQNFLSFVSFVGVILWLR